MMGVFPPSSAISLLGPRIEIVGTASSPHYLNPSEIVFTHLGEAQVRVNTISHKGAHFEGPPRDPSGRRPRGSLGGPSKWATDAQRLLFSCVGTQEATLPVPTQENRSFVLAYLGGHPPNPHYITKRSLGVWWGGWWVSPQIGYKGVFIKYSYRYSYLYHEERVIWVWISIWIFNNNPRLLVLLLLFGVLCNKRACSRSTLRMCKWACPRSGGSIRVLSPVQGGLPPILLPGLGWATWYRCGLLEINLLIDLIIPIDE